MVLGRIVQNLDTGAFRDLVYLFLHPYLALVGGNGGRQLELIRLLPVEYSHSKLGWTSGPFRAWHRVRFSDNHPPVIPQLKGAGNRGRIEMSCSQPVAPSGQSLPR